MKEEIKILYGGLNLEISALYFYLEIFDSVDILQRILIL